MKRPVIIVLAMLSCTIMMAQSSGLSIGITPAGWMGWMTKDVSCSGGYRYGVNVDYTCRWTLKNTNTQLGFLFGVDASRAAVSFIDDTHETFTNTDYLGNRMDYETMTHVTERVSAYYISVPLMFSMRHRGFTFSVGPQFMMPLAERFTQTLSDTHIYATYTRYEVQLRDELISGRLPQATYSGSESVLPKYNVQVGVELGYDWNLAKHHAIGVQLFAHYGVWNNYTSQQSESTFLYVAPILSPENPTPEVTVNGLRTPLAGSMNSLDCGIRVTYSFEETDYLGLGLHRYSQK